MSRFNFDAIIAALRETQGGRERNMYAGVKDLFMHSLGHSASNVLVDTAATQASGIPDLIVMAPTGITDKNGKAQLCEWLVVEVKDEPGVFKEPSSRETVFEGKAKYIGIFTEWFLLIDPQVMVLRPVTMRSQLKFDPAQDLVLELATLTEPQFKTAFNMLLAEHAGVSNALKAFRAGDVSKLRVSNPSSLSKAQTQRLNHAKKDFFDAVSSATMMLQQACIQALDAQAARVAHITKEAQTFSDQWQGYELEFSPFRLEGRLQEGPSAVREHDVQAARLKRDWMRKDHHFATETANLILARILLIRFFEDHGFFGEKKYVCNGGVEAFQKLMTYFGEGYTQLLRHAYEKAHDIYAAVFDEMDLDWVLGVENAQLSKAIEMSMMLLSRFDFTTVKGDILTGIYDRFLDPKKRKDLGEYYTPPTIARYMVRHLGLQIGDSVVDPACGSGRFEQALTVLNTVQGIDLNPFSAMIAQVQMLWHLLPMKTQLMAAETFPDIRIAERMNALIQNGTEHRGSLFSEINQAVHAAVVGNPPYVRPERNTQPLFGSDASWFAPMGSAEKNLFSLFIYKALAGMCRPANAVAGIAAGKLAFVVPLSFCDNDDNAALRNLFRIGGQFTVLEIVDLEVIAPQVFDAAVNPIVLIAQNRPATAQDKVCIRVAGPECVLDAEGRQFDLERASKALFDYADVWTQDGRILTKITAQRLPILRKLAALKTLEQAACTFWVGKRGARIDSWQLDKPKRLPIDGMLKGVRWEEQILIKAGAAFRNKLPLATNPVNSFNFYKGENIAACVVEGAAVQSGIDIDGIDGIDDNTVWRFRDILPTVGYAILPKARTGSLSL
jgi:N-6 DNA Methylase